MNIGKSSLQLRFDPMDLRSPAVSPEEQAKRTLTALSSRKVFEDNQKVFSQGQRLDATQRSRGPLYRQTAQELSDLRARLGDFSLANGALFQQQGPTSVTSENALNLGQGSMVSNTITSTTTTVTPGTSTTTESTIDPTAKLNTQPFKTAITAGTVTLQFRVNGGGATNRTVTINPATQSLNDVLASFSNLTVGTKKPLTATFDATSGNVTFQVNSTSGTRFDFTVTGGTSNFMSVIGADARSATETATINTAINNSATQKKYFKLTVNVEGAGSVTLSNLQVSNAGLTLNQKVDELVGQINTGVAGLGVTAVNAGGGKIGFQRDQASVTASPNLGIQITQATNGGGSLRLGVQGGLTTTARLIANPDLTDVTTTTPPVVTTTTTTQNVNTTVGGALGPDAKLSDLAGQLGLNAVNGGFSLAINGQTFSFSENQTLNDVLASISGSGLGLTARYDATARKITVESGDGSAIRIGDLSGNLAAKLGIDNTVKRVDASDLSRTLGDLAGDLGLTAVNGGYELQAGDKTLSFTEDNTLDNVLASISYSGQGLTARYDAENQRIVVEGEDNRTVSVANVSGNLATQLGINRSGEASNEVLAQELTDLVTGIGDVLGLIRQETAGAGLETDPLLNDLQAALGGLFSSTQEAVLNRINGLDDLGFSLDGGALKVDAAKLQQVIREKPQELNEFLGTFIGERVAPLLEAGAGALQNAEVLGPIDARAAAQAVRVRGEISRLQTRQQMLVLERQNYDTMRERVEKQSEVLKKQAEELGRRAGLPDEQAEARRLALALSVDRNTVPPPFLGPGAATPPATPGLSSFGLGQGNQRFGTG